MFSLKTFRNLLLGIIVVAHCSVLLAAALPTADEILAIHQANRQKLAQLHLQLVHTYETTEATCKAAQKEATEKETLLSLFTQTKPDDLAIEVNGKTLRGAEAAQMLTQAGLTGNAQKNEIKRLRNQTKPFRTIQPMELFLSGQQYQFRQPLKNLKTDEELAAWTFSEVPVTPETLLTTYRDISIFSRSTTSQPAGRWWHHSVDNHAYIMRKHLTEVSSVKLPPYTDVIQPRWDHRHAIDSFFSQPADRYRVVRQENVDGRLLTVVDVGVPLEPGNTLLLYRAWLDLQRGAVPMKIYHSQGSAKSPVDLFDHWQPSEIVTTHRIEELPGGAYYPAKTVAEEWSLDPDAPPLTQEQSADVRAGKRKQPLAVHRRYTWDCSTVELKSDLGDDFFALAFPPGQKLFDHDAGKTIGALEPQPVVQVGQPAPPLTIGHWLDGQKRTLDDLKGQVVVLDFWGLWCGACRGSVPKLNEFQQQFRDQKVTFISIHNAEGDPKKLATRIEEFARQSNWRYVAAIDAGSMLEDSVTSNAYGVTAYPMTVIIGPDGKIVYVDPQIEGPACGDEDGAKMAAFEKEANALYKSWFDAVGEAWPLAENLDPKAQEEIHRRVEIKFITRQIDQALKSVR